MIINDKGDEEGERGGEGLLMKGFHFCYEHTISPFGPCTPVNPGKPETPCGTKIT